MHKLVTATLGAVVLSIAVAHGAFAASPTSAHNWTGFYVGGSLGARLTDSKLSVTAIDELAFNNTFAQHDLPSCTFDIIPCSTGASLNSGSARIGSYLGYNWQFAERWVGGLEAGWAWANNSATDSNFKFYIGNPPPDSSFTVKTGWDASLRGRVGFLATPALLVYATGGAAWLKTEITSNCGGISCYPGTYLPLDVTQSAIRHGWTIGGGIEDRFAANWIVRAEYRYADFGTVSYTDVRPCAQQPGCNAQSSLNVAYDLALKTHTVSIGVAYKFGQP